MARRVSWKPILLVGALASPRCSTAPPCGNFDNAAHATVTLQKGCGGYECAITCDDGWLNCDGNDENGCETSSTTGLPPNTELEPPDFAASSGCSGTSDVVGSVGQCSLTCAPGFLDCNDSMKDGCETPASTGCFAFDGSPFADVRNDVHDASEPTTAHQIAYLGVGPRGLVACAGKEYVMDRDTLYAVDTDTLLVSLVVASPLPPIDGLACDGAFVYWATASDADASLPTGTLCRVAVGGGAVETLYGGLEPTSGIDVTNAGVLVMTTSGLVLASVDAGVLPWMPGSSTGAYKSFVEAPPETWSVDQATIYRRDDEAGVVAWVQDAGLPTTLVASTTQVLVSLVGADGGPAVRLDCGSPRERLLGAARGERSSHRRGGVGRNAGRRRRRHHLQCVRRGR